MKTDIPALKAQWSELLLAEPKLRIRDAAARLGVSEAELLATRCGGDGAGRLEGDWTALIAEFPQLGEVMCLTRNEAAVHERYGAFTKEIAFFHGMGQVVGPDIDLRLFMEHWKIGFAVTDPAEEGPRRSLQFFDASGTAVHKVYLTPRSEAAAYDALAAQYRAGDQSPVQPVVPAAPATPDRPDAEVDGEGFRRAWLGTGDTHEFFGLLKKFGVGREQALRLAPPGQARRLDLSAAEQLLQAAASSGTPIMVFVGSPGCIQIHTGPVENIKRFGRSGGSWINVLDEKFNLHLNETLVASAWEVRKATRDGHVTSVELYDARGGNIALFFGKRKPGEAEDPDWRRIVAGLPGSAS